jgi:hypothetical protein
MYLSRKQTRDDIPLSLVSIEVRKDSSRQPVLISSYLASQRSITFSSEVSEEGEKTLQT